MQKISFKNSRNKTLIGTLWPAASKSIIIFVHGSDGNRFAKGLFEKLITPLHSNNYNVLTFDLSGHGESEDDIFSLAHSVDDLQSAVKFAQAQGYTKIALFGHSFGALTCLQAYSPTIETMVLLGAMTGAVHWKWEHFYGEDELKQLYAQGYATTPVNDGLREIVKSDVAILDELAAFDQQKIVGAVKCPVLIIHGDGDPFELEFTRISEAALPLLPKESELKIIPGAQHNFLDHATEVAALATGWYQNHFPVNN